MTRRACGFSAVVGVAMIVIGCERNTPAPTSATIAPATTTASANEPTTSPATQPAFSLVNINGHSTVFPPARMRIERDDDHLIAILFSDDPREALNENYTGNSFYLRMDLDINDPAEIGATEWRHKTPSSAQHEDSPYGLFLSGRKSQLQPFDVTARFRRDEHGAVTVLMSGQFEVVSANGADHGSPQIVPVGAELPVRIDKMPTTAQ